MLASHLACIRAAFTVVLFYLLCNRDAAHRVHPLAGQGLNLGIGDVECLSKVIDRTVGLGGDIGK